VSFITGTRLGPYEILGPLGSGGMGDVYRAHDTRLGRDVEVKMLPAAFTADRDRLTRFEREARLLASLNHPHIGAIYGLEPVNGVQALVLELIEGETLAERLAGVRPRTPGIGSDARGPTSACRWPRRSPSPGRSPMRSTPRTSEGSSTAI
jgi:serine/threonine protein kinase